MQPRLKRPLAGSAGIQHRRTPPFNAPVLSRFFDYVIWIFPSLQNISGKVTRLVVISPKILQIIHCNSFRKFAEDRGSLQRFIEFCCEFPEILRRFTSSNCVKCIWSSMKFYFPISKSKLMSPSLFGVMNSKFMPHEEGTKPHLFA